MPVSPLRSATSSRHASAKRVTVDPEPTTMSTPTSRHQSRTSSATTLLASPEINTEESRLVLKSGEEQVDLRKRDKNFLRYHYKVNCLSMHIPAGRSWGITPRNHEYSLILAILNWCSRTSFAWAQFVKWIGKLLYLITTNLLSFCFHLSLMFPFLLHVVILAFFIIFHPYLYKGQVCSPTNFVEYVPNTYLYICTSTHIL